MNNIEGHTITNEYGDEGIVRRAEATYIRVEWADGSEDIITTEELAEGGYTIR